jgi:hypothetical protein
MRHEQSGWLASSSLRWSPALWAALIVLCGVVFLDALAEGANGAQ